jgi:V/A-type H+-transporting ATPase subunit D
MAEAASKTQLLERRAERTMVREGKSVLEDRRDLLAHMLVEQLAETDRLTREAARAFAWARQMLRRALMRHGLTALTLRAGEPDNPMLGAPRWELENRLGTPWLTFDMPAESDGGSSSDTEVSVELEGTRRAYRELVAVLLELAAGENNLSRLVEVFRRTQRRVNALEYVVLPDLNRAIKEMEDRMDEMEREDLVRLLLIKRRAG